MAPREPGPRTGSGAPTKSDQRHLKAQAHRGEEAWHDAYEQGVADGKAGTPDAHRPLEADLDDAYDQGVAEGTKTRAPSAPAADPGANPAGPGPNPPAANPAAPGGSGTAPGWWKSTSKTESIAGFVLGMIGYAVGINFLRGGPAAVRGWFGAKFLNKPYTGAVQASPYQAPVSPSVSPLPSTPVGPPVGVPSVFGNGSK